MGPLQKETRMKRIVLVIVPIVFTVLCMTSRASEDNILDALTQRAKIQYEAVPRKVLAFYYPWYGNAAVQGGSGRWSHWSDVDTDKKQIAASTNFPTLGPYDSHDPKLIAQHAEWSNQAGVDGWIVSWWGRGSFSDRAMARLLDGAKSADLQVTVYYENVPGRQSPESAAQDIIGILDRYASHPAWFRVENKPVIFVYGRAIDQIGLNGWLRAVHQVNSKRAGGALFFGDQLSERATYVFDGIHTYNTAGALRDKDAVKVRDWARRQYPDWVKTARSNKRISTITVIPGYDDTKIRTPGLRVERYRGDSYRYQWEEAIAADPDWILITSWNEWHEGSEIEPSEEYGTAYLEMTAELAARFKAKPRRGTNRGDTKEECPTNRRLLEKLAGVQVGVLPDCDPAVLWWTLGLPQTPQALSWEQVARLNPDSVRQFPILVYGAGEHYRQTVEHSGDVDEGLLRYLKAGGLLIVLPNGPMPFHYNKKGSVVASSAKFGLPLSVAGRDGGWEEPPRDVKLHFVQPERRLPELPAMFPFPEQGDLRWRPFARSRLANEDVVVPLLELRDEKGRHHGDAVAYVEHRASQPVGGRVLYAWFGLVNSPMRDSLLVDLFSLAAERKLGPVE
jgi:hypothetical protein